MFEIILELIGIILLVYEWERIQLYEHMEGFRLFLFFCYSNRWCEYDFQDKINASEKKEKQRTKMEV